MATAMCMADEVHTPPPPPPQDDNIYKFGRIGDHNVVIACLSEIGTIPAARGATRMPSTFTKLRFGLMVGIGGGVPSK